MRHPAVWGQLWQLSFTEGSASFQLHSQSLRLLVQFLGQTLCWGGNQEGHLGSGNKLSRSQPKYVSELKEGVVQLALTTTGACAAMKSGDVFCWGSEDMILPGLPENEERLLPVLVQELKGRVKLLGLTGSGGCFLTVTNEVMCWGGKELIGMGESIDVPKNKLVLNTLVGGGVKKIAVLGNTCIIDMNDRVLCWGGNYTGQSRPGRVSYFIYTPNFIDVPGGAASISSGWGSHNCAVTQMGLMWCWGSNSSGQFGDGSYVGSTSSSPRDLSSVPVIQISTGQSNTCALNVLKDVYCWGSLPPFNEERSGSAVPTILPGFDGKYQKVSIGGRHGCVLDAAGDIKCWGANESGQLGDGTNKTRMEPTPLKL